MNVKFRDEIGYTVYTEVAQIVPISNNEWSLMFTDYTEKKVKGQFVEAIMEGY